MNRAVVPVFFACLLTTYALPAVSFADPMGGGGGQAEYSAARGSAFSRLAPGITITSLGIGLHAATNLGPRLDLRIFGNYTNLTHNFSRSGFSISLNAGMANMGAMADVYPLRRFPLRLSPGFLFFNSNELSGSVRASNGATFTINNVQYGSDAADPVHGNGGLKLSGSGFMLTAGIGHYVSHASRRVSFPFEAGVAFINRPIADFQLSGRVCSLSTPMLCEPAAQFPGFAGNLAAQVASWNRTVAPYHIYPVFGGGVAYSFTLRRRGVQ